jgi:TolB protein
VIFKLKFLLMIVACLIGCQNLQPRPTPQLASSQNQARPLSKDSAGQLAYIGADGNIYVTIADRSFTLAITGDATTYWEGPGLSYQRISWSPTGQLAYAAVSRSGDKASSKLYVVEAPGQPAQIVGQSNNHFVIYIYWSPAPCATGPTCRQLAYLIEEDKDIGLRLVKMDGDKVENKVIGLGWPYYFSWSADGSSIVWHTGARNQEDGVARISRYSLSSHETEILSQNPANFMAPAWSPPDNSWLGVATTDEGDYLQLFGPEETIRLSTVPAGGAAFIWSPDGSQVAYALKENDNQPFYGPIYLYDVTTGDSRQLTDDGLRVAAFFWDPVGQRLGYLTLLSMPHDARWMQWRVFDTMDNSDRGFKAFNPSAQMKFVMSSFNQYAQSHRFWSPDGRYLVYGSRNELSRKEQVWLVDTQSNDGNNAIYIDDGTMGFWSWN